MEQTEKYLNNILSKRLGSVINQSAFSKNAHTVTRIPRQEEKVQSMPTVFRQKYQTVLMQQSSQTPSSKISVKNTEAPDDQEEKPTGSHRVEYMAISKRLMTKKQDNYISPTVDITKYQKKQPQKRQLISDRVSRLQAIKQEDSQPHIKAEQVGQAKPKRRKIFS